MVIKKGFAFLLLGLLLITTISAAQTSLGTFKQGEDINIFQVCDSCTAITISAINYPNSSTVVSDISMSTTDNKYYNYSLNGSLVDAKGTYTVNGFDDVDNSFAYDFFITSTGDTFTTQTSIFYFGVMVLLVFLFLLCIAGFTFLPSFDNYDSDGTLLSINNLKYLRLPLLGVAWGILVMIAFLAMNLAEAYLTTALVVGMFRIIFTILMISAIIGVPLLFWFMVSTYMKDIVVKRYIERGLM